MMSQLLDHYNEELRFLRQEGVVFARENPQVASRLGLHPDAITDPFVERLLEGIAFLSARVHTRMDRECAEFAQQALARIAPSFCCGTPSISTFSFHVDYRSPESQRGRSIPKGSTILSEFPGWERPVRFVTARAVQLLPLRLAAAECSRAVVALPKAAAVRLAKAPAMIYLKFELEANAVLGDISKVLRDDGGYAIDPLTITLGGDAPLAFGLLQTIMADTEQIHLVAGEGQLSSTIELPLSSLRLSGMDNDNALLPADIGGLQGIRLLREYFVQPASFLSFELHGVSQLALSCPYARSFEVVLGLKSQPEFLLGRVTPRLFHLYATPAINLYPRRLDPLTYDPGTSAQWVPVDRMRPRAYHLFSLTSVNAVSGQGRHVSLDPVLGGVHFKSGVPPGHYGLMRHRIGAGAVKSDDPLASYDQIVVSLSDDSELKGRVTSLQMEGLVSDLGWRAEQVLRSSLSMAEPMGLGRIECLWVPSVPRAVPDIARCWEAVAFVGESPLGTERRGQHELLTALIRWIGLAADPGNPTDLQRISSLQSMQLRAALAPCRSAVPVGWIHTIKVVLDISEAHHADRGGWLFGRVIAQALSRCVHMNEGLEVELRLNGHLASSHSNLVLSDGAFL
jgi:type VI secretion system protein ImpG